MILDAIPSPQSETVELLKLVANGGAVVAVIAVTVMFLRFIKAERIENRTEREGERKAFSESLERVVAANQTAMRDLSEGVDHIKDTTNTINTKLDNLLNRRSA